MTERRIAVPGTTLFVDDRGRREGPAVVYAAARLISFGPVDAVVWNVSDGSTDGRPVVAFESALL